MDNEKILDISFEEVEETQLSEPKILHDNSIGKCLAYLKNFDYYYIFCIVNPKNPLVDQHIKLPIKFVEENNSSYENLLDEFLKITGLPFATHNNDLIVTMTGENKRIHLHPITFNRTRDRTFCVESGDTADFMFVTDMIKHRNFLQEYEVQS